MDGQSPITNMDILDLLAKRVKEYRLAARMSQRELAEKSGVGYTTISHFEQGKHINISLGNFISLLRCIGMEGRMLELLPELPARFSIKGVSSIVEKAVATVTSYRKHAIIAGVPERWIKRIEEEINRRVSNLE